MLYKPLTREEVVSVIEGKSAASRVPVLLQFWIHEEEFGERKEMVREIKDAYPEDAQIISFNMPEVYEAPDDDMEYRWVNYDNPYKNRSVGLDAQVAIPDWKQLDDVLEHFPNPDYSGAFPSKPLEDGRYRLGHWWYCLFERHWQLRGMTEALMDYYTFPDEVHRLFRAVTDFYIKIIERSKTELGLDGIFVSDDFGTQTGPFFSLEIFREFYRPYYKEIIDKVHSLGMHFWLHSCGNIEIMFPEFIDLKLDVIHPIQKYTMDEKKIAERFGKDICIWAGFDVQKTIPWGRPEDVRKEVRFMMDTYYRPEGRFMFTAGNGINGDCKIDSLKALYDESFKYGSIIGKKAY